MGGLVMNIPRKEFGTAARTDGQSEHFVARIEG